jgi:sugar phosphate isomerase/epimerase
MIWTRREFGRLALSGVSGTLLTDPSLYAAARQAAKPNSRVAGVQIGLNVPYSFRGQLPGTADDILNVCQQLGLSALELRMQPVEHFLGSPAPYPAAVARAGGAGGRAGGGAPPAPPTPEQIAARRAAAEELRTWRLALPMARVREFRRKYEDAGVAIDIVKVDPFDEIFDMTDEEVNYFFDLAKNLGARAISCELLDRSVISTKLLGAFAEANRLRVAYHGHAQAPPVYERALGYSTHNALNIDLGHFVAANNVSPVEFIRKHHERITHVHVKDRKMHEGPNMPFGEGDTPIKEVLRLIRDNKWNMMATIEYEYPVPPGSTVLAELRRSVQ